MPNWCMNSLQITASKENIEILAKKLDECGGKDFFDIFVPNAEQAGQDENWYAYNGNTYGCKWNCTASDWDVDSGDGTTITINFDSPWGPPIALYDLIDAQEGFSVAAGYYEPGMCFVGEYVDGNDDYYDYTDCNSETIYGSVPGEIVDRWGISEQMADYEAENNEN